MDPDRFYSVMSDARLIGHFWEAEDECRHIQDFPVDDCHDPHEVTSVLSMDLLLLSRALSCSLGSLLLPRAL